MVFFPDFCLEFFFFAKMTFLAWQNFFSGKKVPTDFLGWTLGCQLTPSRTFMPFFFFSFFFSFFFKTIFKHFSNDMHSETTSAYTKQAVGDRKGTPHILHKWGLWTTISAFVPAVKKGCMLVHRKAGISLESKTAMQFSSPITLNMRFCLNNKPPKSIVSIMKYWIAFKRI